MYSQSSKALKYFDKGIKYFNEKDYIKADSFFLLSVKNDTNYIDAYYNLAMVKVQLGDTVSCCNYLKKASKLGDTQAQRLYFFYCDMSTKYNNEGVKYFNLKNFHKADSLFNLSLNESKNIQAYYNLALTKLNEYDTCGYCKNLKIAWEMGENGSLILLHKDCYKYKTIMIPDLFKDGITRINTIELSKCDDSRNYIFIKMIDNDTILKYNTSLIQKGRIINVISKNFSYDSCEYKLLLDTTELGTDNENLYIEKIIKEKKYNGPILTIVEEMPKFPGGEENMYKWLGENIRYPQEAKEKGISGTVIVTYVVESDGEITNVHVLKNIEGGCGAEAVRVIKTMPKWKPAELNGVPVRIFFTLPIKFTLE